MRWKQARPKPERMQPKSGTYRSWKEQIATDCHGQCVYCAINDTLSGFEIRFFTIDHFRPKSLFPSLENDIANLYYCCAICNSYKSNDWPCEVQDLKSDCGYVDPSEYSYTDFLQVDGFGRVSCTHSAGIYMIEKLHLNRAQLVGRRKIREFQEWSRGVRSQVEAMSKSNHLSNGDLRKIMEALLRIAKIEEQISSVKVSRRDYRADM
jgi:HNH endonuclease